MKNQTRLSACDGRPRGMLSVVAFIVSLLIFAGSAFARTAACSCNPCLCAACNCGSAKSGSSGGGKTSSGGAGKSPSSQSTKNASSGSNKSETTQPGKSASKHHEGKRHEDSRGATVGVGVNVEFGGIGQRNAEPDPFATSSKIAPLPKTVSGEEKARSDKRSHRTSSDDDLWSHVNPIAKDLSE